MPIQTPETELTDSGLQQVANAAKVSPEAAVAAATRLSKGTIKLPSAVKPPVVCLCGSMKFSDDIDKEAIALTLAGAVVLVPNVNMKRSTDLFQKKVPCPSCRGKQGLITICDVCNHTGEKTVVDEAAMTAIKARLDELHLHKVALAEESRFVNVGGYIGESTIRELSHALRLKKVVSFTSDPEKSNPQTAAVLKDAGYARREDGAYAPVR